MQVLLVFHSYLITIHQSCTSQLEAPKVFPKAFLAMESGSTKDRQKGREFIGAGCSPDQCLTALGAKFLVPLFLGWDNTETVSQNRPVGWGHKVLQAPQSYVAPSLLCFISLSHTNATWTHCCYPLFKIFFSRS